MKFFKKMGVAVATLVLSVAAAITIGQVRESSYTQPENNTIRQVMKDYEDEEGLAQLQEICKQYVVDNAMVIDSSATDKIVNTIANMAVRDDGVIAVATETFAKDAVKNPEDLERTAERFFEKLELDKTTDAIMVIDTESTQHFMYDPSGKIFADMSEAELKSVEAALQRGFEEVANGNMNGIGEGVRDAYDAVAKIISDPSAFVDLNNAYVVESEEGIGFDIVEKTVDGRGWTIVSGIVNTAKNLVSMAFRLVGGSSVVIFLIVGGIILIVKNNKKKNKYGQNQNGQAMSGQGGRPGRGGGPGKGYNPGHQGAPGRNFFAGSQPNVPGRNFFGGKDPGAVNNRNNAPAGRNLSQSGNIDTSKISTQGSQYRWSANKNPYSGLNNGRTGGNNAQGANNPGVNNSAGVGNNNSGFNNGEPKDMSGFVFPGGFGSNIGGTDQNARKPGGN